MGDPTGNSCGTAGTAAPLIASSAAEVVAPTVLGSAPTGVVSSSAPPEDAGGKVARAFLLPVCR
jgi:hypothetical protein